MLACRVVCCSHQSDRRIRVCVSRCVTRQNNGCEGDCSKRGTDAFYICSEVLRQFREIDHIENRPQRIDHKE